MRVLATFAAFVLGAAGAWAQPESPVNQARRLLQSPALREKAWGAWYAGASHDPTMFDPLLAALRQAQSLSYSPRDSDGYAYVQALFDALIQIPGPVPDDAILPFEDQWRPEILVLLSRNPAAPGAESALLDMREHSMADPEWATVNDLLYGISSKPFFQETLEEIRATHDFVVVQNGGFGSGGSSCCADSSFHFPAGFPPIALYHLSSWPWEPRSGDTLLIGQPIAVHYHRAVVPTDGRAALGDCRGFSAMIDGVQLRQTYMALFLSASRGLSAEQSRDLFHPQTTINWLGNDQAVAEMEGLLSKQAASIQALVEEAQERGMVQASGVRLPIDATVQDMRGDRNIPLPEVRSREILIP